MFSSQQIVLVVADDINSSTAQLQCYEDSKKIFHTIKVNLGKNGLGWGLGKKNLTNMRDINIIKKEGDKRAPAGIFTLNTLFGYSQKSDFHFPYLYASKSLICVDDTHSKFYNQIIEAKGDEKSFEYMHRNDDLYKLGIVVGHNQEAKKGYGSCIFLHIQRAENSPTVGCTSMKESDIRDIAKWLDKDKNPILIQIPKNYSKEIIKLYPNLKNSQLLREKD
ncbi:L,D-transpeptidase family protein [Sulfurimonas sp.]